MEKARRSGLAFVNQKYQLVLFAGKLFQVVKDTGATKLRHITQRFFDSEQLVVFGDTVGSRRRAGFDLSGIGCHGDVGDGSILCFTGTMRYYCGITGAFGHFDGIEGFGQCTDLIDFDQNRIGGGGFDAARQTFRIGDEEIVADELYFVA